MKKKNIISLAVIALMFVLVQPAFAQGSPPPPPPDNTSGPIDSSAGILLVAAAALGYTSIKRKQLAGEDKQQSGQETAEK